jgi:hypothetical protein
MILLRVYRIILLVRAHELDEADALLKHKFAHEPIFIASNIENYSAVFQDARVPVLGLDVLRRIPNGPRGLVVPGLESLLALRVKLPELYERATGNDPHP